MPSTEERIRKLVDDNLEIEGRAQGQPLNLDNSLRDSGVSSVDFVAFAKVVAQEFNVQFRCGRLRRNQYGRRVGQVSRGAVRLKPGALEIQPVPDKAVNKAGGTLSLCPDPLRGTVFRGTGGALTERQAPLRSATLTLATTPPERLKPSHG